LPQLVLLWKRIFLLQCNKNPAFCRKIWTWYLGMYTFLPKIYKTAPIWGNNHNCQKK
jgi:hypothetical protein